jgi:hypothetical protein
MYAVVLLTVTGNQFILKNKKQFNWHAPCLAVDVKLRSLFWFERSFLSRFLSGLISIAGFQSRDMFSAWWSTPNGNTFIELNIHYKY